MSFHLGGSGFSPDFLSSETTFVLRQGSGELLTRGELELEPFILRHLGAVRQVCARNDMFAALTEDGRVFTWGRGGYETSLELNSAYLENAARFANGEVKFKEIRALHPCFVATTEDGSEAWTWGDCWERAEGTKSVKWEPELFRLDRKNTTVGKLVAVKDCRHPYKAQMLVTMDVDGHISTMSNYAGLDILRLLGPKKGERVVDIVGTGFCLAYLYSSEAASVYMLNNADGAKRTVLEYKHIGRISAQGEFLVLDSATDGSRVLYLENFRGQGLPQIVETGIKKSIVQIVSQNRVIKKETIFEGLLWTDVTRIRAILDSSGTAYTVRYKEVDIPSTGKLDPEAPKFKQIAISQNALIGLVKSDSSVYMYTQRDTPQRKKK
jgi:hypothetical protein